MLYVRCRDDTPCAAPNAILGAEGGRQRSLLRDVRTRHESARRNREKRNESNHETMSIHERLTDEKIALYTGRMNAATTNSKMTITLYISSIHT
jgi:hypothetical protein